MCIRIVPLLLLITLIACDQKEECIKYENCVRVKLHKEFCGQAILEILDPMNFNKGQNWADGNGIEYQNVFSTILPCTRPDQLTDDSGALKPGIEFYIQFADSQDDNRCAVCLALLVGPEKFSHIKIVNNCEETGELE